MVKQETKQSKKDLYASLTGVVLVAFDKILSL